MNYTYAYAKNFIKLLNQSILEKYDTKRICNVYDNWPIIAKESYEFEHEPIQFDGEKIVFTGMGGSGSINDLVSSLFDTDTYLITNRFRNQKIDSDSLVVFTSVSGNTRETLDALIVTKKLKCNTIVFSSGGLIEQYCIKNNLPFRKIPMYHSPRSSLVSYAYSMIKIFESIIPMKKVEIKKSILALESTGKKINTSNLNTDNISLSLAYWIKHIPILYYTSSLRIAAIRCKNSIHENAKLHAMAEDLTETCHNGIAAWEKSSKVQPIFIKDQNDSVQNRKQWNIIQQYFNEKNIDYKEIFSIDGNLFSKLINLIYVLDYASIYLAILSKTDPSPIKLIDFIKNNVY